MSIGSLNSLYHPGGPRWVLGHRGEADQGCVSPRGWGAEIHPAQCSPAHCREWCPI